jgi:hypothetical protein
LSNQPTSFEAMENVIVLFLTSVFTDYVCTWGFPQHEVTWALAFGRCTPFASQPVKKGIEEETVLWKEINVWKDMFIVSKQESLMKHKCSIACSAQVLQQ